MKNTTYLTLSLALLALPFTVNAQERTVGGPLQTEASWSALANLANQANSQAKVAQVLANAIVECGKKRMFYGPGQPGADAQGCLPINTVTASTPSTPRSSSSGSSNACTASSLVCQAYATNTGRVPDKAGAAYWEGRVDELKASGLSQADIKAQIDREMRTTPEVKAYQATGNAINPSNHPTTSFCSGSTACGESAATSKQISTATTINSLYQSTLGRAPDAQGAAYWQSQVDKGLMTIDQVKAHIQASPEAQKKK